MKTLFANITFLLLLTAEVCVADSYPNDPYFHSSGAWTQNYADQWSLETLRVYTQATVATSQPQTQQRAVVAVIDTGIDYTHPDFAAEQLWRNPNEKNNGRDDDGNGYVDDLIGWNFVDGNNNPWDQSGHGTHISGLIAACTDNGVGITAINADAVIMPLKVANFVGQARSSAVAAAIYYAVNHGARVINLSLGGEVVTELERDAAQYAADNNVLIVVSAGNRGLDAKQNGYTTLPGVLVVGASDQNDQRAGFSNFGANVDVLAPGVDILSLRAHDTDFIALTDPRSYSAGAAIVGDDGNYYRASGTSFATAHVSGLASRIFSLRPQLTAQDVHHMLVQSAIDIGAEGVDQQSGYGRVDLVRALAAEPHKYVDARLTGVQLELKDEHILLHVQGSARADQFATAELNVRAVEGSISTVDQEKSNHSKTKKKKKKRKSKKEEIAEPNPYDWQPFAAPLTSPVIENTLASLDLEQLKAMTGGSNHWELRLLVTHRDGSTRESRLQMSLPPPPDFAQATAGGPDDG